MGNEAPEKIESKLALTLQNISFNHDKETAKVDFEFTGPNDFQNVTFKIVTFIDGGEADAILLSAYEILDDLLKDMQRLTREQGEKYLSLARR